MRALHAGRMGFIDEENGIIARGEFGNIGERCQIAVHRIEAFNGNEAARFMIARAKCTQLLFELRQIIMRESVGRGFGQAQTFMRAGMHQRIVKHKIAALGQGRDQRRIGGKACTKKQSAFCAKESLGFVFECFMFGMVAAQETRAASAHRDSALESIDQRRFQRVGFRQSQIIVGRKINTSAAFQRAQTCAPV